MKSSANNTSSRFTGKHWILTVVGIITAVVCSFIVQEQVAPSEDGAETRSKNVIAILNQVNGLKAIAAIAIEAR